MSECSFMPGPSQDRVKFLRLDPCSLGLPRASNSSCNSCSQAGRALPQTLFSLLFSIHSALNLSCFFLSSALAKWCSGLSPFSQTLAWEVRRDCSVTVCERVVCLSCCLHLLRVWVSRGYRCVLAWE